MRHTLCPLAVVCLLLSVLPHFGLSALATSAEQGEVRLLQSDAEGIVLEVLTPAYTMLPIELDGILYHRPLIAGYGQDGDPGKPQLPQKGFLLGIPPDAALSLTILEEDHTAIATPRIAPAPQFELDRMFEPNKEPEPTIPNYRVRYIEDPALYNQDAFYPAQGARLEEPAYFRDQRIVCLRIHPIQYNPVAGQMRYTSYVKVKIAFQYPERALRLSIGRDEHPDIEALLKKTLLNYDSARGWRRAPAAREEVRSAALAQLAGPAYKIGVNEEGMYHLTRQDLQNAGLPVNSVDPRTIRLYNKGQEVAIYVRGQDDGHLDAGDEIIFYGQPEDTKYTGTNVYWLTYGAGTGLRMAEVDGQLTGTAIPLSFYQHDEHWEENIGYWAAMPGDDDLDRWYWKYILAWGGPKTETLTGTLPFVATEPHSATLRVSLYGYSSFPAINPDHHVKVYVNDQQVADVSFDGLVWYLIEADVDASYLREGANEVKVQCVNDRGTPWETAFVDWAEWEYLRSFGAQANRARFGADGAGRWEYQVSGFTGNDVAVFEITDSTRVERIVNSVVEGSPPYTLRFEDETSGKADYRALTADRYLSPAFISLDSPSDLHGSTSGADYIIITHRDFLADVQPLALHRQKQGLRTVIIDVQDIYDEFNHGLLHPKAIRDFLAYASHYWTPPAPSYALLVGDGHWDLRDRLHSGLNNYIPPYLAFVDPWQGEIPVDNRYACFSGDDVVPDILLGRFPVNGDRHLESTTMVNKATNYESATPAAEWMNRILFVTDDPDIGPGGAGDFPVYADDAADNHVPLPYMVDKIYLKINYPYENPSTAAKNAIIQAFNEGRLLINYVGHGAPFQWAAEKLLHLNDIGSLANGARLPIMLPMTCNEGNFSLPVPTYPSLSESLVRADGKGAIASWAPTGLGTVNGHHYLHVGFLDAAFRDHVRDVGLATLAGRLNLFQNSTPGNYYHIEGQTLLGDPALLLPNCPPVAGEIDPNAGQSLPNATQLFSATYRDGNGWQDIRNAYLLVNTSTSKNSGLYARHDRQQNKLYLWDPVNSQWLGGHQPGQAKVIETSRAALDISQCIINGLTNTLTITWAVKFKAPMSGVTHNTYLYVEDGAKAKSSWQQVGTWLVNRRPSVIRIKPRNGQSAPGAVKIFKTIYKDADGANDLESVYLLINKTPDPANGFYARYDKVSNLLYFADDGGTLSGGVAPGTPGAVLSNSYAELNVTQCRVRREGSRLIVKWVVRFKESFSGERYNQYLRADDIWSASSGFVEKGTWAVNCPPAVVPPLLDSGNAGPWVTRYFTATYSDPDGWQDISEAYILFNRSAEGAYGVYALYEPSIGLLYLRDNRDIAWLGGYIPGSAETIENGQGILDVAETTVSSNGTDLIIRWAIRFRPAFLSMRPNRYLKVIDKQGASSGWIQVGVW